MEPMSTTAGDTEPAPGDFHPDHPIFHDPSWAMADALGCDDAYGKPPAYQVAPTLARLRSLGWDVTRTKDPEITDKPAAGTYG